MEENQIWASTSLLVVRLTTPPAAGADVTVGVGGAVVACRPGQHVGCQLLGEPHEVGLELGGAEVVGLWLVRINLPKAVGAQAEPPRRFLSVVMHDLHAGVALLRSPVTAQREFLLHREEKRHRPVRGRSPGQSHGRRDQFHVNAERVRDLLHAPATTRRIRLVPCGTGGLHELVQGRREVASRCGVRAVQARRVAPVLAARTRCHGPHPTGQRWREHFGLTAAFPALS